MTIFRSYIQRNPGFCSIPVRERRKIPLSLKVATAICEHCQALSESCIRFCISDTLDVSFVPWKSRMKGKTGGGSVTKIHAGLLEVSNKVWK